VRGGKGIAIPMWSCSGIHGRHACEEVMVDMSMAIVSAICRGVVGAHKGKRSRPDPLAARMSIREQ
jgi:hypothetical protein